MSNFQQVAFSPFESSGELHGGAQARIEKLGIGVIRFTPYDSSVEGAVDANLQEAEEILARAGGLLLGDELSVDTAMTEQAQAILDRIRVANDFRLPIFVPDGSWLRALRLGGSEAVLGGLLVASASGIDADSIIGKMHIVEVSRHERPPYGAMKQYLQRETVN